ncbi:hypothetical protein SDC9_155527 [bioreactor metagenome]|uniref:Uncharacterized protein n=1 Tax=bioreactor metagenome TaxID=1076179 RepID=A0A645F1Q7_9ZZZZ
MDMDEVKLESIKRRLLDEGEEIQSTRVANGYYIVNLKSGPEIQFKESYKSIVDAALKQAAHGFRDSSVGKFENVNGKNPVS